MLYIIIYICDIYLSISHSKDPSKVLNRVNVLNKHLA